LQFLLVTSSSTCSGTVKSLQGPSSVVSITLATLSSSRRASRF
jgi:hypothetical protein